jgi:tellurite resistance protein
MCKHAGVRGMMTMEQHNNRLQHFSIAWFAVVMGLAGVAIAWLRATDVLGMPWIVGAGLRCTTVAAFTVIAALYLAKLLRYRAEVMSELGHPVRLNFFPTISIGLILLSIAFMHQLPNVASVFWLIGASIHLLSTLYVMSVWIHHTHFTIQHMNPAWFIPVVGNILIPVSGMQFAHPEVSWFFFSIGLMFWLILATIVFYRVIFHGSLPARMVPTLFILIAPPAVGFIAYVALTGEVDRFARVLYYTALFLTLLLLTQVRQFARLPFFLSWWAYSFPLAAMTIATMLFYARSGYAFLGGLSYVLLTLLSAVLVMLVVRTALGVWRREICVVED